MGFRIQRHRLQSHPTHFTDSTLPCSCVLLFFPCFYVWRLLSVAGCSSSNEWLCVVSVWETMRSVGGGLGLQSLLGTLSIHQMNRRTSGNGFPWSHAFLLLLFTRLAKIARRSVGVLKSERVAVELHSWRDELYPVARWTLVLPSVHLFDICYIGSRDDKMTKASYSIYGSCGRSTPSDDRQVRCSSVT